MIDAEKIPQATSAPDSQVSRDQDYEADRDYAGARSKTDPREIQLVRKMDIRIMVRLRKSIMTLLTNLYLAYFMAYVFLELR
jgi:hypothetical protein